MSTAPNIFPGREELLCALPKNAVVAEIGVDEGVFAKKILDTTTPATLHLIDCWEQQSHSVYRDPINCGDNTFQLHKFERVKKLFASMPSVQVHKAYSETAVAQFPDEYFDWIYIDANHAYQAVKRDLELWYPKVKAGGIMLGHDWITAAEAGIPVGVIQAVTEFLDINGLELAYLTSEQYKSYGFIKPS